VFTVVGYQYIGGTWSLAPSSDNLVFVLLGWLVIVIVIGTIVGLLGLLFVRRDVTAAFVIVAGMITGIVAALVSAPISANVFGGVTGAGTDFLVLAFRQAGADIQAATLGQGLISDPIDKVITFFVVYVILGAMAVRTKARFPQGERLIAMDDIAPGPVGDPAGVTR
jgi:energy-coupling factor transport system substrate-specific component